MQQQLRPLWRARSRRRPFRPACSLPSAHERIGRRRGARGRSTRAVVAADACRGAGAPCRAVRGGGTAALGAGGGAAARARGSDSSPPRNSTKRLRGWGPDGDGWDPRRTGRMHGAARDHGSPQPTRQQLSTALLGQRCFPVTHRSVTATTRLADMWPLEPRASTAAAHLAY
jgi:hypothetical protein